MFWVENWKKGHKYLNRKVTGLDIVCRLTGTWKCYAKMKTIEVGLKLWSGCIWLEDHFQARKRLLSQKYPD